MAQNPFGRTSAPRYRRDQDNEIESLGGPTSFTRNGRSYERIGNGDLTQGYNGAQAQPHVIYDDEFGYGFPTDKMGMIAAPDNDFFTTFGPLGAAMAAFAPFAAGGMAGMGAGQAGATAGLDPAIQALMSEYGGSLAPLSGGADLAGAMSGIEGAGALGGSFGPTATLGEMGAGLAGGGGLDTWGLGTLAQQASLGSAVGPGVLQAGGITGTAALGSAPSWLGGMEMMPSIMDAGTNPMFNPFVQGGAGSALRYAPTAVNAASRLMGQGSSNSPAQTVSDMLKEYLGVDISPGALGMLGTGLATGLGVLGSQQQNSALQSVIDQQKNVTQPFLDDAMDMMKNPDKFYQRPEVMGAIDASMRGLSAQVGNPYNSPGAIAKQAAYNTGLYNNALNTRLATGLGAQEALSKLQVQQALNSGNTLNAIGSGLGSMLSNRPDFTNVLAGYLMGQR